MKNSLWKLSLPGIILVTSLLASCGGGGGSDVVVSTSTGGIQNTTGTLRVSLTDAPSCGFEAVNITVAKVRGTKAPPPAKIMPTGPISPSPPPEKSTC